MKITARLAVERIAPAQVCSDCGHEHGTRTPRVASWHMATCDVCGDFCSVTAAREFGILGTVEVEQKRRAL